jgi:hypothetical protein
MKNYKKNLSTLCVFLLLSAWANFAIAVGPVACTGTGTSASPITDTGDALSCLTEPDIYKIKIYEMGLCTGAPTLANMATTCISALDNPAGGLVTVANGANSDVLGTFTRPANGTYAHGYLVIAPEFRVTATKTFTTTLTGQGGGTGTTCWTLAGTFRDSKSSTAYDGSGALTPISPDNNTTYMAKCGALGAAAPAETIIVQDSFNGTKLESAGLATISFSDGGSTISGSLTDSDLAIAGTSAAVTRMVGFVSFAAPVTITDDSTTFVSSFRTSKGSLMDYATGDKMTYIGSGPFFPRLSVE